MQRFLAHPEARGLPASYYGLVHGVSQEHLLALAGIALEGTLQRSAGALGDARQLAAAMPLLRSLGRALPNRATWASSWDRAM